MKKKKETRGRPSLPEKVKRDYTLRVRLSQNEQTEIETAANGKTSTWAREVLLRAARLKAEGEGIEPLRASEPSAGL